MGENWYAGVEFKMTQSDVVIVYIIMDMKVVRYGNIVD